MKKFLAFLMIFGMVFSTGSYSASADGHVVDLLAGQNKKVGTVTTTNDGDNLYVEFDITEDGWCLMETHVHVGESLSDFPLTKGKVQNPIPGQFKYKAGHDCVENYVQEIPLNGFEKGEGIILIATHSVVASYTVDEVCTEIGSQPSELILTSQTGDDVWGPVYTDPSGNINPVGPLWGSVGSAVQAINTLAMPWNWGSNPATDIVGAVWISTSANTENWNDDSWKLFEKDFTIPLNATNISASVEVNADNEYWVYANGVPIGNDNNIFNPLLTHNFSPNLGPNYLSFIVKNQGQGGAQANNPNGLIYKATISYETPIEECHDEIEETGKETAWGKGTRFTEKGNWGMYFEYTVADEPAEPKLVETLSVDSSNVNGSYSATTLENGKNYQLKVYGTWTNRPGETVDAKYTTMDGWSTHHEAPVGGYPDELLELQVNNGFVDWGAYSASHEYSLIVSGTDSVFNFRVFDGDVGSNTPNLGWYGDNVGSLTVEIYEL